MRRVLDAWGLSLPESGKPPRRTNDLELYSESRRAERSAKPFVGKLPDPRFADWRMLARLRLALPREPRIVSVCELAHPIRRAGMPGRAVSRAFPQDHERAASPVPRGVGKASRIYDDGWKTPTTLVALTSPGVRVREGGFPAPSMHPRATNEEGRLLGNQAIVRFVDVGGQEAERGSGDSGSAGGR